MTGDAIARASGDGRAGLSEKTLQALQLARAELKLLFEKFEGPPFGVTNFGLLSRQGHHEASEQRKNYEMSFHRS
jgi:hypothetical protein